MQRPDEGNQAYQGSLGWIGEKAASAVADAAR